jgi:predicted acyl esterase
MAVGSDGTRTVKDGEILIEKDVCIPLADGQLVSCNVLRPNRAGRFPPIVVFTPYGKDSDVAVDLSAIGISCSEIIPTSGTDRPISI